MQCLHPIKKNSNARYFLPGRWQSYQAEFPCGECEACRQNRQIDEYIRCMWESKYTMNVCHGYQIFDTLSLDNAHLSHVQDICDDFGLDIKIPSYLNLSCFRLSDWRSFITNLNAKIVYYVKKQLQTMIYVQFGKKLTIRQLHKTWKMWFKKVYGFDVPKHLYNYLMASEYGHDEEYIDDRGNMRKGTRRPHYHVIFFCYLPEYIISAENFSRAISASWKRGRTDGVDWPNKYHRSVKEWRDRRVFTSLNDTTLNINVLNVLSYIAKYIGKDQNFKDKFGEVESDLFSCIFRGRDLDDLYKLVSVDYEGFKMWKRFKRNLFNFSKKGHDYGVYYIDWLNSEEGAQEKKRLMEDTFVVLPMNKKQTVYRHALPGYYVNKLFKESYRDKDGYKRWRWSEEGLAWKKRNLISSIDGLVKNYKDFVMNYRNFLDDADQIELRGILSRITDKEQFYRVTARWYRLFEGRIMDKYVKRLDYKHIDPKSLPSWKEMVDFIVGNLCINDDSDLRDKILSSVGKHLTYDGEDIIFNYQNVKDVAHFGRTFLVDRNLGDYDHGFYVNRQCGWNECEDRYYKFRERHSDDFHLTDCDYFGSFNVLHAWMLPGFDLSIKFKKLFDKYNQNRCENKEEKFDVLAEIEERQSKCYKISKKYRK